MTPEPPRSPARATYFDGRSARRQAAWITVVEDGLRIEPADAAPVFWPMTRLRRLPDNHAGLVLTLHAPSNDETSCDPARLVPDDAAFARWVAHRVERAAPSLDRREGKPGMARRLVLLSGAALVSILALLFAIIPALADRLALHLPLETEVALGDSVVQQLQRMMGAERMCAHPEGEAALARLTERLLEAYPTAYPVRVGVIDHDMVNAFAAPGGRIVLMRGLIETAESAEEIAGVLAHELGHVEARDPTRLALRSVGSAGILSLLLGDVGGGTLIAVLGDTLLQAQYTRAAEQAADGFALNLLHEADIDGRPLADFFTRIAQDESGIALPAYLSTHPDSLARAARAQAHDAARDTAPLLGREEWRALRDICRAP